jgi:hypothetical protein
MINTDKYEGHTPADEWRLVFREVNYRNIQMLGLTVRAYHLGQMQACDHEDYIMAQANQDLARDAPLLLAEVKRLRGLLQEVADDYTDAEGITYEIYCDFGGD